MVDAAGTGQTNDMYNWTIEEAEWLPIPISTTYRFGTLFAPADLALVSSDASYAADGRLKFYTATIGTDGYVELKKVTDNICQDEPTLVRFSIANKLRQNCLFILLIISIDIL